MKFSDGRTAGYQQLVRFLWLSESRCRYITLKVIITVTRLGYLKELCVISAISWRRCGSPSASSMFYVRPMLYAGRPSYITTWIISRTVTSVNLTITITLTRASTGGGRGSGRNLRPNWAQGRIGFSWWEACGPACLRVTRWETVKALALTITRLA